jgi:superoxide dismutase, Fe-Mn family
MQKLNFTKFDFSAFRNIILIIIKLNLNTMIFDLIKLPYEKDSLEPYIFSETIEYHYGKHLATYVDNINKFIENTEFMNLSLDEIIKIAPAGPIFNNAAQVWNHNFYFEALTPEVDEVPT